MEWRCDSGAVVGSPTTPSRILLASVKVRARNSDGGSVSTWPDVFARTVTVASEVCTAEWRNSRPSLADTTGTVYDGAPARPLGLTPLLRDLVGEGEAGAGTGEGTGAGAVALWLPQISHSGGGGGAGALIRRCGTEGNTKAYIPVRGEHKEEEGGGKEPYIGPIQQLPRRQREVSSWRRPRARFHRCKAIVQ